MLATLAFALVGCKSKQKAGEPGLDETPTYADLAEAHNKRIALLEDMYAFGAIEIKWTDEDGNHFEQGDLDVWLRMPDRIALQVGKAGERFFWLGGNSEASWFFDVRKKARSFAEIHAPNASVSAEGDVPIALSMTALLELMGLSIIPTEQPGDVPGIAFDHERRAWVLTTTGSAGLMRIFFDARRSLPVRVELLTALPPAAEGGLNRPGAEDQIVDVDRSPIALYSVLPIRDYEYIFMKGRSVDQFPLVPTLVDVFRGDGSGSLKISVSRPVSEDESFQDGYFDLHWLLEVLQPAEVRDFR